LLATAGPTAAVAAWQPVRVARRRAKALEIVVLTPATTGKRDGHGGRFMM
jgi:hypothetical protein